MQRRSHRAVWAADQWNRGTEVPRSLYPTRQVCILGTGQSAHPQLVEMEARFFDDGKPEIEGLFGGIVVSHHVHDNDRKAMPSYRHNESALMDVSQTQ